MSRPVIALTTDFGQADGYVGTMKGVILGICPSAEMVDVSHEIRPQAVRQAAYVLHTAAPYFPAGTVHLVVVDPSVGTARRPIVVQTERATYVAPDNGVLSLVLARDPARLVVHLTASATVATARYCLPQISATFHGRDIFAPAAAHLACGIDPHDMGDLLSLSDLVTLSALHPKPQANGSWQGEILHVDRFGNLVINYQFPTSDDQYANPDLHFAVEAGGEWIVGLSRAYAGVAPGELVAYVGSSGYLEVAVREGNASVRLDVDVGDPVQINRHVTGRP